MHSAKIIADSLSPLGARLTTMEIVFPRIILSEFNTHRVFSRNSASSRAIPVEKMIRMVNENPYVPNHWGKNQKGMSAEQVVDDFYQNRAADEWLEARNNAIRHARNLVNLDIHKQITNRLLEPFMWHTCIVSATEWSNFFHLRNHPAAHPDIQIVAKLMQEAYENHSHPITLSMGEWHLPYIFDADRVELSGDLSSLIKICVGRCARVSYLTHDGTRELQADLDLHDKLLSGGHMSPLEHAATPLDNPDEWSGNFRGWKQYRKTIPREEDILAA